MQKTLAYLVARKNICFLVATSYPRCSCLCAIAERKLAEEKQDLKQQRDQYPCYQNFQIEHPDDYKKPHDGNHQNLIYVATHKIKANNNELDRLETKLPSEDEFYELTHSYLLKLLNTTDLMEQDIICNDLVPNLYVGDDTVSVTNLNKPYDLLVDLSKISIGRVKRTLLELLKHTTQNPDTSQQLLENLKLAQKPKPKLIEGVVF